MVYHGVVSRACQGCRKRKIKCDQERPECLKCRKSGTQCPGYRSLDDILFRDETERVICKARQIDQAQLVSPQEIPAVSPAVLISSALPSKANFHTSVPCPVSMSQTLSQPIHELGANFFFTNYISDEPPLSSDYNGWLVQSYFEGGPNNVLRIAIEAIGMAGISNVFHAPHVASKYKEQYCEALNAMKHAMNDPARATADTTFLAVILLGFFETVNFEAWDRYRNWAAHIKGSISLLALRGEKQFMRERGVQLYVQIRSQILLACMQQHIAVPPALVQMTRNFKTSAIRKQWQQRSVASSGSVCQLAFRIVNLQAALKNGEITDSQAINNLARGIDNDLETWETCVPKSWRYTTVESAEAAVNTCFGGKRHVYPNVWTAEVWNNWRTLRIVVNQIIMENELRSSLSDNVQESAAVSIIQQFSTELCISAASFTGSSRILSLIRPMYVVSLEELNPHGMRCFAIEQLRRIGASMGIRQAGLLAEAAAKRVKGDFTSVGSDLMIPLIPYG